MLAYSSGELQSVHHVWEDTATNKHWKHEQEAGWSHVIFKLEAERTRNGLGLEILEPALSDFLFPSRLHNTKGSVLSVTKQHHQLESKYSETWANWEHSHLNHNSYQKHIRSPAQELSKLFWVADWGLLKGRAGDLGQVILWDSTSEISPLLAGRRRAAGARLLGPLLPRDARWRGPGLVHSSTRPASGCGTFTAAVKWTVSQRHSWIWRHFEQK